MARAISLIENQDPVSGALMRELFGRTGHAYLIGITGPPGAGKSTLVDRLVTGLRGGASPRPETRELDHPRASGMAPHGPLEVGVIAVDPTSPFSGGAVLGDRLRMQSHVSDEHVFIRSMATRGHLGGLSRATADAALVLDAAGKDVVLIETVGVGQDEVDIVRTADVSVVMLVPGAGDEVQALKAGIMEIADIFVVNKSDREGTDRLVSALEATLTLQSFGADEWRPPVLQTIATSGEGVSGLLDTIWAFRLHAERMHAPRRRLRDETRLRELVSERFMGYLEREVLKPGELAAIVDRIEAREIDPYTAANELLGRAVQLPDHPIAR
jgi:LAO/AO transport system kinase